jgi:hypothetical protein
VSLSRAVNQGGHLSEGIVRDPGWAVRRRGSHLRSSHLTTSVASSEAALKAARRDIAAAAAPWSNESAT